MTFGYMLAKAAEESSKDDMSGLITAGVGFIGVLAGGMITLAGQYFNRKAEHRDKVTASVVVLLDAIYSMETNMTAWSAHLQGKRETPDDIFQDYIKAANDASAIAQREANQLSIKSSGPIRRATISLYNALIEAGNYVHPALGDGSAETFKHADLYMRRVELHRRLLTEVARTPGYRRWIKGLQIRKQSHRAEAIFNAAVSLSDNENPNTTKPNQ